MLNIIGSVSNAIAAIAAVVAIGVTVRNYKADKREQRYESLREKRGVLYKESVIDCWLNKISADILAINQAILRLSDNTTITYEKMQELYCGIRAGNQSWVYEMEIIRVFDEELYQEIKLEVEKFVDIYSRIITESLAQGKILEDFWVNINKQLIAIRKRIYEKYLCLEENSLVNK